MPEAPKDLPSSILDPNGNEIGFLDIHRAFADTPMGQELGNKIRYARYKPASVSTSDWEHLLGADVNNLKHMPLTYGLARAFLKSAIACDATHEASDDSLTTHEAQILLATAIVHDWAEADPTLGDIMYDLKLDSDEKKESQILTLMLRNQLGHILSPETLGHIHKTATDKTGKLGIAFNTIERIGYLRTALNAWKQSKNPIHTVELSESLIWLCSNVLSNQIPGLLNLRSSHDWLRDHLDAAAALIDEAFRHIPDTIFNRYPAPEQEIQKKKYLAAKAAWEHF